MAVFTRTPFIGEFLNLNDLFLWIGVLAAVRMIWQGKKLWAPKILVAIIAILVVGDFQAVFQYGFHYEVLQTIWWEWSFPLLMFAGAIMVRDEQSARYFYWALFLGSFGAALQHFVLIESEMVVGKTFLGEGLRTISFIMSGGIFLVISAFFLDMRQLIKNRYIFILWAIGIPFIVISYILSFTRTVWIGAVMAMIAMFILFYRKVGRLLPRLGYVVALLVTIFIVFRLTSGLFLSGLHLEESIDERADFLRYEDTFDEAYQTRETGMETELGLWEKGFFIWGVGACYPLDILNAPLAETGAYHHVAFSTYLAHFGLIGLLTYGILLPLLTIRVGRRYFLRHKADYGGAIAITAMALAFFDIFTLLSSNHYISPIGHVQGLIYGAMWGLSSSMEFKPSLSAVPRAMFPAPAPQWLPGTLK